MKTAEGYSLASARGLRAFVVESNRIEGILREPTEIEVMAHAAFLPLRTVTVADMESFVGEIALGKPLRREPGMDVRVGDHLPPRGGPEIEDRLHVLLGLLAEGHGAPYEVHQAYERLHPFMDGNGRSGRVLWAWHMRRDGLNPFALPFLHRWYYQSLDAERATPTPAEQAGLNESGFAGRGGTEDG